MRACSVAWHATQSYISAALAARTCERLCRVAKPSVDLQLHADVDGSLEALTESLLALNTGKVIFKVVKASVGTPTPADVEFANMTGASLVAFGVEVPGAVEAAANQRKVPVLQSKCAP
jgi:translation initiation factor IF-2